MNVSCQDAALTAVLSKAHAESPAALLRALRVARGISSHRLLPGPYLPRWTGYPFKVKVQGRTYDLVKGLACLQSLQPHADDFGGYEAYRQHLEAMRLEFPPRLTVESVKQYGERWQWSPAETKRWADRLSTVLQISLLLNVPAADLVPSKDVSVVSAAWWSQEMHISPWFLWGLVMVSLVELLTLGLASWRWRRERRAAMLPPATHSPADGARLYTPEPQAPASMRPGSLAPRRPVPMRSGSAAYPASGLRLLPRTPAPVPADSVIEVALRGLVTRREPSKVEQRARVPVLDPSELGRDAGRSSGVMVTVAPLSTTPSGELVVPSAETIARALAGKAQGQTPLTYRVIKKLGSGGMGRVELIDYQGEQRALKVLHPIGGDGDLSCHDALKRFVREVRVLSSLGTHPHLIRILGEPGITPEGEPCYMMEYFPGETLIAAQSKIAERSVPQRVGFVMQVAEQVLDALAYAHQRGITHRDIKPSNIMFQVNHGRVHVKVVDLGIAKPTEEDAQRSYQLTRGDEVVGTCTYMPPERFEPKFGPVDARGDLFSLGAVLHELLGGRHPFRGQLDDHVAGSPLAALLAVAHKPALPLPSEIPAAIRCAIDTALAKRPEDRFTSAMAFWKALSDHRFVA